MGLILDARAHSSFLGLQDAYSMPTLFHRSRARYTNVQVMTTMNIESSTEWRPLHWAQNPLLRRYVSRQSSTTVSDERTHLE